MTRKQKIEAEAFARYIKTGWPLMLGGNIAIAAKLRGKQWIHTPATPEAAHRIALDGGW